MPFQIGNNLGSMNKGKPKPSVSLALKGKEKSVRWRGDKVSYRGLHNWVERQLGKPRFCEECGSKGLRHRQYHWANVSGGCGGLVTGWRRLCVKCHRAVDTSRV